MGVSTQEVRIAVLDMDGSLYAHKDPLHHTRETFYHTMLGISLQEQITSYISQQENIGPAEAQRIFIEAAADDVGPSRFLSQRYQISRQDYFAKTWGNLETDKFVDAADIEAADIVINAFRKRNIRPFLLTAAPRVWAAKVLDHLDLGLAAFKRYYYGENYNRKADVFSQLAKEFNPATVLTIGDEYKNDILPAHNLGMQTYHITPSTPLLGVIERLA